QGTVSADHAPTFLASDRTGRYLLSAYYQGGYAAVHRLGDDGAVSAPALDRQDTANGAHAIQTDPSNKFAFVPHIARLQDNVLEPPKNNPGPNFIAQFRFDAQSGRLTPNRSEEHTSELQSPDHLVCRLLLEKKNNNEKQRLHTPPDSTQEHEHQHTTP